jgi:hypothetical protein
MILGLGGVHEPRCPGVVPPDMVDETESGGGCVTPWWKLGLALVAVIGLFDVMDRTPGWVAVVVLTAGTAVLGIAGALWGTDSRERGDWLPDRRSRSMRG